MSKSSTNSDKYGKHCGHNTHFMIDCIHLGKSKCSICGKFGHTADKCWKKGKGKGNREDEDKNEKKQKKAEINEAEEEDEEIITLNTEEIATQEVSKDKPFFDDDKKVIILMKTICII